MEIIKLPLARYQFTFKVTKSFSQGDYAGSMLRGVFGHALKKITCITKQKDCKSCLMYQNCTYPAIFETPPQAHAIQQFTNVPNPYIIETDGWGRKNYQVNDIFKFSMVLTGLALEQLSLIILVWQQAFKMGMGRERGTGELVNVDFISPDNTIQAIYHPNNNKPSNNDNSEKIKSHYNFYSFENTPIDHSITQIHISLISLLRLQKHSKAVGPEKLKARDFLVTLMRRINLINEFHNNIQLIKDFHHYSDLAENIKLHHDKNAPLKWQNWTRYSNRQQQKMLLGGVIGDFTLEGDLNEFIPYLKLGEYLHVGKNTVFGLGQYRLK